MAAASSALSPKPQLLYFNVPGRVCGLRIMMFKIYGKDGWEDQRVEFKDWPALKPTLPLKYMPLLTMPDGKKVHQTDAMVRWAGKKAGLYPASADDALFVDEMISTVYECLSKAPRPSNVVTAEMLPDLWKEFTGAGGTLSMYFDYIQARIEGPFFGGEGMSAADLTLYSLIIMFMNGEISFVDKTYVPDGWPGIGAHYAAVEAHELVQAFQAAYDSNSDAIKEVKDFESVNTDKIHKK